jgi:hypothetical protein
MISTPPDLAPYPADRLVSHSVMGGDGVVEDRGNPPPAASYRSIPRSRRPLLTALKTRFGDSEAANRRRQ